jgi:hypothetical protein
VVVVVVLLGVVVVVVVDGGVGQGFGTHVPGGPMSPPAPAHWLGVSTTQAKAPIGEPGSQHWIVSRVVAVMDVVVVIVVVVVGHRPMASQSTMLFGTIPSVSEGTARHASPFFLRTHTSALLAITPFFVLPLFAVPRQQTTFAGRPHVESFATRIIAFRQGLVRLGSCDWSAFVAFFTQRW